MKSRRGRRADRVVKHALADGTVKEYRYAPYRGRREQPRASDSLTAMIAAFQRSPKWRKLAANTQQNYTIYLRGLSSVGHVKAHEVRRRDLLMVRDAIAAKRGDGAANGFARAVSAAFGWAVDQEWMEHSPATKLGLPGGHLRAWTQAEADRAISGLPEPLRRVVVLALYTGQRRGDLCALAWSAFDGTSIRLRQEKTDEALVIRCHPTLKAELSAWKREWEQTDRSVLTILRDSSGQPWRPTYLSSRLPRALAALGLSDELNVHGLRKLAAARLADAGCTTHEIAAITGHRTLSMVQLYTRSADQERLASAAIVRLSRAKLTNAGQKTTATKKT